MTTENEESSVKQYQRYCEGGCGYKLPWEYKADELYCGACLDVLDEVEADLLDYPTGWLGETK